MSTDPDYTAGEAQQFLRYLLAIDSNGGEFDLSEHVPRIKRILGIDLVTPQQFDAAIEGVELAQGIKTADDVDLHSEAGNSTLTALRSVASALHQLKYLETLLRRAGKSEDVEATGGAWKMFAQAVLKGLGIDPYLATKEADPAEVVRSVLERRFYWQAWERVVYDRHYGTGDPGRLDLRGIRTDVPPFHLEPMDEAQQEAVWADLAQGEVDDPVTFDSTPREGGSSPFKEGLVTYLVKGEGLPNLSSAVADEIKERLAEPGKHVPLPGEEPSVLHRVTKDSYVQEYQLTPSVPGVHAPWVRMTGCTCRACLTHFLGDLPACVDCPRGWRESEREPCPRAELCDVECRDDMEAMANEPLPTEEAERPPISKEDLLEAHRYLTEQTMGGRTLLPSSRILLERQLDAWLAEKGPEVLKRYPNAISCLEANPVVPGRVRGQTTDFMHVDDMPANAESVSLSVDGGTVELPLRDSACLYCKGTGKAQGGPPSGLEMLCYVCKGSGRARKSNLDGKGLFNVKSVAKLDMYQTEGGEE